MSDYNCGVRNCGNGKCVHQQLKDACPNCGNPLIKVTTTGHVFCSGDFNACGYEKEGFMDLEERIDQHLRQMAPHVRDRETAKLLDEAGDEIRRLKAVMLIAKKYGEDSEAPFFKMMETLNENT